MNMSTSNKDYIKMILTIKSIKLMLFHFHSKVTRIPIFSRWSWYSPCFFSLGVNLLSYRLKNHTLKEKNSYIQLFNCINEGVYLNDIELLCYYINRWILSQSCYFLGLLLLNKVIRLNQNSLAHSTVQGICGLLFVSPIKCCECALFLTLLSYIDS